MAIFTNVYFLPVVQSFNINIDGVCWTRQGVDWYFVHASKIYTVYGGFHLVDLIITELKDHMTLKNLGALIGKKEKYL